MNRFSKTNNQWHCYHNKCTGHLQKLRYSLQTCRRELLAMQQLLFLPLFRINILTLPATPQVLSLCQQILQGADFDLSSSVGCKPIRFIPIAKIARCRLWSFQLSVLSVGRKPIILIPSEASFYWNQFQFKGWALWAVPRKSQSAGKPQKRDLRATYV